jgi:hypothetical protein
MPKNFILSSGWQQIKFQSKAKIIYKIELEYEISHRQEFFINFFISKTGN